MKRGRTDPAVVPNSIHTRRVNIKKDKNHFFLSSFGHLRKPRNAILCLAVFVLIFRIFWASSTARYLQCGHLRNESHSRLILTASHLRQGPDGELRLRIIEHNLRLLYFPDSVNEHDPKDKRKPMKSILIFSHDGSKESVRDMVNEWRLGPAIGMVDEILIVPNDAVNVDFAKWMAALKNEISHIWSSNARVMLMNDSFLLVRNVEELWDDGCGSLCGLAWTAPKSDPSRHIQSYMRSISACELHNLMNFYEENKNSSKNVHELIQKFEINLEWVRGRVSAIYSDVGSQSHPDADGAQRLLIPHGYPAIKLKKFFETDDPWLAEDVGSRVRVSPAFSAEVYKKLNHDLNHMSDEELEDHFAKVGYAEGRIYSKLPLVIKRWMKEELMKIGKSGEDTLAILEDYLEALNRANAKTISS